MQRYTITQIPARSRIPLEKLIDPQRFKKFPVVFKTARRWST